MSIYPINDFLTTANAFQSSLQTAAPTATQNRATASLSLVPASTAPAKPAETTPNPAIKTVTDSVKLSQDAQIQLLTQQGQSPAQIANALGLPVATIDSDLYIVTASATPTVTPSTSFTLAA